MDLIVEYFDENYIEKFISNYRYINRYFLLDVIFVDNNVLIKI